MFNALVVNKGDDEKTSAAVEKVSIDQLPEGNVTVAVEYSTVNYKDGLCIGSGGGMVRNYPHVPGIDFSGTVEASDDDRYSPGDKVVLTGWRVGEVQWGGYSQKARVNADWLVPLPELISSKQAMAIGTAGLTAMLAIIALEQHGLKKSNGSILVTGGSGGVGSVAIAILSKLGYEVATVTGRPESAEYLKSLGASIIVPREELNEAMQDENLLEVADALTDILYVTYGAGHAFGIDLDKCFDEVQNSNMSKLDENGKPIYNENGKVMKGPNYFKPDLSKFIN